MKKVIFILSMSLILVACGSTGKVATSKELKHNPNFDYTPPERANPRSAGITIALINPTFIGEDPNKLVPPYSTFVENMGDDFEEMIIAKGISLRGPFVNRDEMVYGDKKNSDIALEIKISLKEEGNLQMKRKNNWAQMIDKNASNHYTIGGTFYHFGNIIIEASDPFTGEKFWKKTVSLPRKEITAQGNQTWTGKPTPTQMLSLDTGIYNPISRALESYYQDALKTAWRHIDVEEMKMIKKEIRKSQEK